MKEKLKKIVHSLLCCNLSGIIITNIFSSLIPDLRWNGFKFRIPQSYVNKRMSASVFWGFYESAEIRLVEKYLRNDLNVIELGSSIGIVSSHIISKMDNHKHFLAVEANPFLIEAIQTNVANHNKNDVTFTVVNKAVSYNKEEVKIGISDNHTESSIVSSESNANGVFVKTVSLSELVKVGGESNYILVCDIEGSEVEMLLLEKEVLTQCSQLFIELHDTLFNEKYYNISMLKNLLEKDLGFVIKEQHGPVVYCERY